MSKQDRQGVRTATQLEQKYQFGKTFAEIMGIANDARESVDSVASTLRSEMQEQATTLKRDTEQIVMEATKTLVKESDFDKYKEDAKTEFKVFSDGISTKVEKTTEEVSSLSEKIDGIEGLYFYIMYSEYADGHIMTSTPNENTIYMGTCSTNEPLAPVDYREYTWTKIKGTDGIDGKDAILLMIDSSAGNIFKNSNIATTLTVTIIVGDITITNSTRLQEVFGNTAKLKWQQMSMGETEFTDMDESDPRFLDNGFIFTLNAHDISTKAVFNCLLDF